MNAQQVLLVKSMTEETDDEVISAFLELAGQKIYNIADPFKTKSEEEILEKYSGLQAQAAAYLLNKRGAEGQTAHTENGIARQYETGDLPPSLVREITQICEAI